MTKLNIDRVRLSCLIPTASRSSCEFKPTKRKSGGRGGSSCGRGSKRSERRSRRKRSSYIHDDCGLQAKSSHSRFKGHAQSELTWLGSETWKATAIASWSDPTNMQDFSAGTLRCNVGSFDCFIRMIVARALCDRADAASRTLKSGREAVWESSRKKVREGTLIGRSGL
ncbi:hypothetical protein L1887_52153 [Cichorium endivia]|nr:hypothetical protein L1887_52153 [Cichorium endivia]